MKKIPATYELTQDDIKEAITEWLNENHDDDNDWNEYNISFGVSEHHAPGKGLPSGMNDDIVTTVINAVAIKDA
jgi:hypothetical protein